MVTISLERSYRFSAAHRYHRPEWSEEENLRRFGKCSYAPGHGHNYRLTIRVSGRVDPETGFVVDLSWLDQVVNESILETLDHRLINDAVPTFAPGASIPTCESLVVWMRDELSARLPPETRLVALRLAEDDDLAALWQLESSIES